MLSLAPFCTVSEAHLCIPVWSFSRILNEQRCIPLFPSVLSQMLFFVKYLVKSGSAPELPGVLSALLPTILSVQETDDDDLSLLAKQTLAYLKLQPLLRPPAPTTPGPASSSQAASALSAPALHPHLGGSALSFDLVGGREGGEGESEGENEGGDGFSGIEGGPFGTLVEAGGSANWKQRAVVLTCSQAFLFRCDIRFLALNPIVDSRA